MKKGFLMVKAIEKWNLMGFFKREHTKQGLNGHFLSDIQFLSSESKCCVCTAGMGSSQESGQRARPLTHSHTCQPKGHNAGEKDGIQIKAEGTQGGFRGRVDSGKQ